MILTFLTLINAFDQEYVDELQKIIDSGIVSDLKENLNTDKFRENSEALDYAARNNKTDMVKALYEDGKHLRLPIAAFWDTSVNNETLEVILNNMSKYDIKNRNADILFHLAENYLEVQKKTIERINQLIKHEFNIDAAIEEIEKTDTNKYYKEGDDLSLQSTDIKPIIKALKEIKEEIIQEQKKLTFWGLTDVTKPKDPK